MFGVDDIASIGTAVGTVGSALGNIFGSGGTSVYKSNKINDHTAYTNYTYNLRNAREYMSNLRHGYNIAGFNPILATGQGVGSSNVSGSSTATDPTHDFSGISDALNAWNSQRYANRNAEADTNGKTIDNWWKPLLYDQQFARNEAETARTNANTDLIRLQAIGQQLENSAFSPRLKAELNKIASETVRNLQEGQSAIRNADSHSRSIDVQESMNNNQKLLNDTLRKQREQMIKWYGFEKGSAMFNDTLRSIGIGIGGMSSGVASLGKAGLIK